MMFARRRSGALASAVELTPLIDVVLLLLIFFMVSTTFLRQRAIAVALPEAATASPAAARPAPLEVEVGASGETLVDGRRLANAGGLLEALAAEHHPGRPLLLAADRDARHYAVVRVLDAARRAGFVDVQLAARSPAAQAHGR